MSLPLLEALLATAREIKEETEEGANTADKIGTFLENVIQYLQDVYNSLTNGGIAITALQTIPITNYAFTKSGESIANLSNPQNHYGISTNDVSYNVFLPSAVNNIGKSAIVYNSGENAFTLVPQNDELIIGHESGLIIGVGAINILLAIDSTNWIVLRDCYSV